MDRADGLTPAQYALFDEASAFGMRDGFTVPFHDEDLGFVAAMSFAFGSSADMGPMPVLETRLKLLALYYHDAIERLLMSEAPPPPRAGL